MSSCSNVNSVHKFFKYFAFEVHSRTVHPPKLDLAIVTGRNDQGKGRMKTSPVDTTVVAFQDEFNNSISASKDVSLL